MEVNTTRPPPPIAVGVTVIVAPGVAVAVAASVPAWGWPGVVPGAALAFGSTVPLGAMVIVGVLVMVAVAVRVGLRVAVITGTGEGAKLAASESQPDNSIHTSAAASKVLAVACGWTLDCMHAESNLAAPRIPPGRRTFTDL